SSNCLSVEPEPAADPLVRRGLHPPTVSSEQDRQPPRRRKYRYQGPWRTRHARLAATSGCIQVEETTHEHTVHHARAGMKDGRPGWVRGGAERQGWRSTRPAGTQLLPAPTNPPRPATPRATDAVAVSCQ